MGKETTYCAGCGRALRQGEFESGKAGRVENRALCLTCLPTGFTPAARAPKQLHRATRRSEPEAAPRKRWLPALGGGAALAAVLGIALVLLLPGSPSPLPPPPPAAAAPPEPPPAPFVAHAPPPEPLPVEAPAPVVEEPAPAPPPPPEAEPPRTRLRNADPPQGRRGTEPPFDPKEGLRGTASPWPARPESGSKPEPPPPPAPPARKIPAPEPPSPENRVPALTVVAPRNGAAFNAPAEIEIRAEASDPDGRIVKAEFFRDSERLGEAAAAPYAFAWRAVPPGRYSLVVRVTDDRGAVAESPEVYVLVNAPVVVKPAAKAAPARAHPRVDPKKVDEAIRKGVDAVAREGALVRARMAAAAGTRKEEIQKPDELMLWTYLHAGVPEGDPKFQELLKGMLEDKLERTYRVALQAMILEELDRARHQTRIWQCAQFLVDNQCRNGQWSYGEPTDPGLPTSGAGKKAVATPGKKPSGPRAKPEVARRLPVQKRRDGPEQGDNSNSQYAALGLRACHEAGIVLPREVVVKAREWFEKAQGAGGGWGYGAAASPVSGSMTAGAVGSVVIYDYILGRPWMGDSAVAGGMKWLGEHFTVTGNPGAGEPRWHHYFLYAMERAGSLYGTEAIGGKDWYFEGATELLRTQAADGSWSTEGGRHHRLWNTCFAILFLRRATRSLDVASEDPAARRKTYGK